jgi:hypothetical protein
MIHAFESRQHEENAMSKPFEPVTIVFYDDVPDANANDSVQGVTTVFTSVQDIVDAYRLKPTVDLAADIALEAKNRTVHACLKPTILSHIEQDLILSDDRESLIAGWYAEEWGMTVRFYAQSRN